MRRNIGPALVKCASISLKLSSSSASCIFAISIILGQLASVAHFWITNSVNIICIFDHLFTITVVDGNGLGSLGIPEMWPPFNSTLLLISSNPLRNNLFTNSFILFGDLWILSKLSWYFGNMFSIVSNYVYPELAWIYCTCGLSLTTSVQFLAFSNDTETHGIFLAKHAASIPMATLGFSLNLWSGNRFHSSNFIKFLLRSISIHRYSSSRVSVSRLELVCKAFGALSWMFNNDILFILINIEVYTSRNAHIIGYNCNVLSWYVARAREGRTRGNAGSRWQLTSKR